MGIASWPPALGDANLSDATGATVLERCCSFPRDYYSHSGRIRAGYICIEFTWLMNTQMANRGRAVKRTGAVEGIAWQ